MYPHYCTVPTITAPTMHPGGRWSEWNTTIKCNSSCIDGVEKLERYCIGGEDCIGNSTKTVPCGSPICGKIYV